MKNKSSAVALLCFAALCAAADLPVITAHRGGRLEYDDNALGTFKQSVARGVRRFETDIRYTKDHRFAIMHDDTLDRTTTGKGYLEDRTLEELRAIRLKKSGEPIPTPEEILDVVASVPDSFIELELKTYNHRKNAPKFYTDDLVREYCRKLSALAASKLDRGRYIFISTDYRSLRIMHETDPAAQIGIIVFDKFNDWYFDQAKSLGAKMIALWTGGYHAGDIDRIHAAGMACNVWPVNDMETYVQAVLIGADGITTDSPAEFMRRLSAPPSGEKVLGGMRVAWDGEGIAVSNGALSASYRFTARGLGLVSLRSGGAELAAPSAAGAPAPRFLRVSVGELAQKGWPGNGLRATVLTDAGQEELDVIPGTPGVIHRACRGFRGQAQMPFECALPFPRKADGVLPEGSFTSFADIFGNGVVFVNLNERFAPVLALAYSGGEAGRAEALRKTSQITGRQEGKGK